MADLHKAIRAIHNSVVTINGNTQETIVAWDQNNNEVNIDWTLVNNWQEPNEDITKEYQINRKNAYPPIGDQLDMLWHSIDQDAELKSKYFDFYEAIKAVKVKYPKNG
tara:strand:- start:144 stop:467 length:324 start_codon:yes stop_codon:yes gene_type:complete